MKRFTENIVERIIGSDSVSVYKRGNYTCVQWGKSMSQIGSGYIYQLAWVEIEGQVVWQEFNDSFNRVEGTGITCICDQINFEDGLFVRLEVLEAEKEEILSVAEKIYNEQSAQALKLEN